MLEVQDKRDSVDVSRLLDGAEKTAAISRWCWLATSTETGVSRMRPMGRLPPEPGDDRWTIRFLTDGRSRKAAEIWRAGRVAIIFQREADDAYVAATGMAKLRLESSEVQRRWKDAYSRYFPSEEDKENAAFLEVEAQRLELWICGVTPEPFGLHTTTLERDAAGAWRLAGDRRAA